MDFDDAIDLVLEDAARVVPRGSKLDVVSRVQRDFAKQGYCDDSLRQKIEEALKTRLAQWSLDEKRGIWESVLTVSDEDHADERFDDYPEDSIDMFLEGELMYLITERLAPPRKRKAFEWEDDNEKEA